MFVPSVDVEQICCYISIHLISELYELTHTLQLFVFSHFQMPLDVQSLQVDISILFGSANMFCAVNRQPSASDYDFSNAIAGRHSDLLLIVRIFLCFVLCPAFTTLLVLLAVQSCKICC